MIEDFVIEEVGDLDAAWPEIRGLIEGLIEYHRPWDERASRMRADWPERMREHMQPNETSVVLAARQDGVIAGFLHGQVSLDWGIFEQDEAFVNNVFVAAEAPHRNRRRTPAAVRAVGPGERRTVHEAERERGERAGAELLVEGGIRGGGARDGEVAAMSLVLVWFLVERDGSVLVGRRKAGQPPFEGVWVLPGDVMLDEESTSETIARFAKQQLDLSVTGDEFVDTLELSDPSAGSGQAAGADYAVNVFRAGFAGEPRFRESGPFEEMGWATAAELKDESMPMPAALRALLLRLTGGSET